MKVPDVEEWPRDLVEAIQVTIEYTFDGFKLYIKHLDQREHNIYD